MRRVKRAKTGEIVSPVTNISASFANNFDGDIRRRVLTAAPPGLRLAIVDAILLHRVDPAKNMHRFYRLDVGPDLFGRWCLVVEWGRIGRAGRLRMAAFDDMAQAMEALVRQRRLKERRGYVVQ